MVKTLLSCPQFCGRIELVDEFVVVEVVPEVDESFCGLPRVLEVTSMNESPKTKDDQGGCQWEGLE